MPRSLPVSLPVPLSLLWARPFLVWADSTRQTSSHRGVRASGQPALDDRQLNIRIVDPVKL